MFVDDDTLLNLTVCVSSCPDITEKKIDYKWRTVYNYKR